jgi:hypothetical protein
VRARASGLLLPAVGFTLWSIAFVSIYASLSFGCAFGWDAIELAGVVSLQRAQLTLLFLLAIAAAAAAAWGLRPTARTAESDAPDHFLWTVGYAAALAALASTVATFAPVLVLTSCT